MSSSRDIAEMLRPSRLLQPFSGFFSFFLKGSWISYGIIERTKRKPAPTEPVDILLPDRTSLPGEYRDGKTVFTLPGLHLFLAGRLDWSPASFTLHERSPLK